jgi:tetratricopeptide (TPR) repeat protein
MTAGTGRLKRTFDWKEFLKRAEGHEERADLSRAATAYETAIELCDDEAALSDLHGRLGEILERRGDVAGAIECYKEALALDTAQKDWLGVAADQRRLGSAYQRSGDHRWAQAAFTEAEAALRHVDDTGARIDLHLQVGLLHEERAKYSDAEDEYRHALSLARDGEDTLRTAHALSQLGSVNRKQGESSEALEHLRQALSLAERANAKLILIEIQNMLGATLEDQGHSNQALEHYRAARDIAYSIDHMPGKAATLRRMGSAHAHKGDLSEALGCFDDAIAICTDLGDEKALSDLYSHVGEVHERLGNIDKAIDCYNQALYLDRRHGDELGMAGALRRLGSAYQERGQENRAEDCYAEAERLLKHSEDEVELAILYMNLGRLYQEQGRFVKARETYKRSLDINELKHIEVGIATCLRHHASVLVELGDMDEAVEELQRALHIHQELGSENMPEIVEIFTLLGAAQQERGNSDSALEHFRTAADHALTIDHPTARGECLRRMGMAYVELGEYVRARECYDEALQIFRELDDAVALSDLYVQVGELHAAEGDLARAVDSYQAALDLDQGHGDKPGMARALRQLGAAYQERGAYERAHESLRAAERLLAQCDDKNELAELHLQMGSLEEERGQYRRAKDLYSRALAAFRQTDDEDGQIRCKRRTASVLRTTGRTTDALGMLTELRNALDSHGGGDRPERVEVLLLLGSCYLDEDRPNEALKAFRQALDLADSIDSAPSRAACYRALGQVQTRLGEYTDAIRSLEESLHVSNDLQDRVALAETYADLGHAYEARADVRDLETAIDHYKRSLRICRSLERVPTTIQTLTMLSRACRLARRYELADECLGEAEELIEALDSREWKARLHLERGLLGLAARQDRSAVSDAQMHFRRAIDLLNDRDGNAVVTEAHEALVEVCLKKRDVETAIEHLRRIARGKGGNPGLSPWRHLLKELYDGLDTEVGSLFAYGKYQAAVQAGFRVFEDRVRKAVPNHGDDRERGDPDTMRAVIGEVVNQRGGVAPFRDRMELQAFGQFCVAAYAALRNPAQHHDFEVSGNDAFCILAIVNLMMTYLLPSSELAKESS